MSNIESLAPIFPVRDLSRALDFYQKIGFKTEFLWEDPPSYAVLSAGEQAGLHLSLMAPGHRGRQTKSLLYLFVRDVDGIYRACLDAGISPYVEIGDRDYGMRDFELLDPDGNQLTIGTSLES
jgi:uncharacterized glyoxalase superfamily protein PhnB